ncbi:DoxX family protein [Sabulilitoribacter multivorans]|uniref:DoxX family protein n=1 Tax=Flaviramulus multivorans TaxID=1304750 RepID=A0ABS9IF98_9FLAO|nr:DoxX family protein [Flaviramulus multivorans]MCF7559013.1 DoxX family protein [Flaviramulus multivorans]
MKTNYDIGLLIIRLIIGIPLLMYGIGKLIYGIDFIQQLLISNGLPSFISYGVYIGEIIAPVLIIIGYKMRLASLVLAINCLVALMLTQAQNIFALNENGGWAIELLAIYILIPIALFFTGGGKFALSYDNKWY